MKEFLFEIGCEELPPDSIDGALDFIKDFVARDLATHRLSYGNIITHATPRRIVVIIKDLAEKASDLKEEVLGPKVAIAFDKENNLSKAGLGFLKKKNLQPSDIFKKETKKGVVIAAEVLNKGKSAKDILTHTAHTLLEKIPFKKRMRWERSGDTFIRPIRWMVAVLGDEYLDIHYADVSSKDESYGHRFLSPKPFKVTSIAQYHEELKKRYVVLDAKMRADMILKQAKDKVDAHNSEFRPDKELLDTVKNLVEYPFVLIGDFEESYLDIPHDILISEMKTHQKCFCVYKKDNGLNNLFLTVANTLPHDEKVFAQGNARVLRARFEDGAFYFAKDKEKSLSEHAKELKNLIFEQELKSFHEKTERIKTLSSMLASPFALNKTEHETLMSAAPIIKADLVTGVVHEFPELQGTMGKIYAQLDGYNEEVCKAIEQHYWPRFHDDAVPSTKAASVLSIADKLDTLVGIFGINKKPKGKKDPYGLRRAALGIVRIIIDQQVSIDLRDVIEKAINAYDDRFLGKKDELLDECEQFVMQRARVLLVDWFKDDTTQALSFVDSVMAVTKSDVNDIYIRCQVLINMYNSQKEEFITLSQTFKRAANIVKKESIPVKSLSDEKKSLLTTPHEQSLLSLINESNEYITRYKKAKGNDQLLEFYSGLSEKIISIKPKLDEFFDNVMVMVDDENLKNARLELLYDVKSLVERLADFRHLA